LIVIAKAPVAGRSKTRLCPPCTPTEAATLAEAALADTLETVAAVPAERHCVALEGAPGAWLPTRFEIVPQRGEGLDERLAHAFADVGGPALLIGMDTPQLGASLLAAAAGLLLADGVDAVFGPAVDGGFWALGLRRPDPELLLGIPMSTGDTGRAQLARLRRRGLRVALLPRLRDVDAIADARAAAAAAPGGRFAAALNDIDGCVQVAA
jgi:rSAM/selenodomain-associated transferase 1